MSRSAVARGIPILKSGLVDLTSPAIPLPSSLKQVIVKHCRQGPGQTGARIFLRTKVPFIRYQNPQLSVTNVVVMPDIEKKPKESPSPVAELIFNNASSSSSSSFLDGSDTNTHFISIDITGKSADEIMELISRKCLEWQQRDDAVPQSQ